MKRSAAIPLPVLYRGFSVGACIDPLVTLIVKHKRVQGRWLTGFYSYTDSDDKHWITDGKTGQKFEVLPETLGFLECESGRFSGDVCYFQAGCEKIKGIVKFGKHKSQDGTKREEISFFIEWQGNTISALMLRQDLLYWTKKEDVCWEGTMWDPKKK